MYNKRIVEVDEEGSKLTIGEGLDVNLKSGVQPS
jgi:hypothetical protein